MIDPSKVTSYGLDRNGLEENILFWALAAGKDSGVVARGLNSMLTELGVNRRRSPFAALRAYDGDMASLIRRHGIGCYSQKARTIGQLISSGIDLRTCGVEELEGIWGIGRKTSRCYMMHTRRDARVAGLDTHVLSFLRDMGVNAPKRTPGSAKEYRRLERAFLDFVPNGMSVAEFDLLTWNMYSRNGDASN